MKDIASATLKGCHSIHFGYVNIEIVKSSVHVK